MEQIFIKNTQDIYQFAIDFAALHHKEQKVTGKEYSYVVHLSNVAMEVMFAISNTTELYNKNLAIGVALLHDIIEDTKITYNDVLSIFGKDMADGVLALTKNENIHKSEQMIDSLNRIVLQPKEIWIVKMADRITNLQPPPYYWESEKKIYYFEESKLIYNKLHCANNYLAERLLNKIDNYKQYL